MAQFVSDCLRTMRLTIARRNTTDPDSSDTTLLQYINDFVNLTMTDDVKLFETFGTLNFTIDPSNTTGVYTLAQLNIALPFDGFSNISQEGFITLTNPPNGSISWNKLWIIQNPGIFYAQWGIDNTDILIKGYPTQMLYYGQEFVFRTIPNTFYDVQIFGYQIVAPLSDGTGDPALLFPHWMRYIAYGAALNYARDYNLEISSRQRIEKDFAHERKLMLTRTHNQIKMQRAMPRF